MAETDITADDLVRALEEAQDTADSPDGLLTTVQLSKLLGRNRKWVRVKLGELDRAGRLECVWVEGTSISRSKTMVPAYRLTSEAEL
jgi:hypothetical protein